MRAQGRCRKSSFALPILGVVALAFAGPARLFAQDYVARNAVALAYLEQHADREQKMMIPMRDGVRLSAVILFPKKIPRSNLPAVIFRTPYLIEPRSINSWAEYSQSFLKNGYAVVFENVRGRYFSEGTYTYLVGSEKDGYDTVDWIVKQPWSNGKVGALGCSSTAEEQHRLNSAGHPAFAASVPMGSGAGIGKVGPYNEMGNFYRGGAVQNFWFPWYYGSGYTYKPSFPKELTREQMIRLGRFWNIEPETTPPSGIDTLIWTLPLNRIPEAMSSPPSDIYDFVNRLPNDPKWKAVDFGGEDDKYHTPTLLINSWYDVSIGPNTAMYEAQSKGAATAAARDNMYMVIAPTTHCMQNRFETEHTVVGQRDMGDARYDYIGLIQKWYNKFLKGDANAMDGEPKVRAYMMGANQWRTYDTWPPREAEFVSYYFDSNGSANSLFGDGRLTTTKPGKASSDQFVYDPTIPVQSLGGSICCFSAAFQGGSFDQSSVETRSDVLVYTTPPLVETVEITGPVKVSLYLQSDVKDTDLTVKLIDVAPDGKAYNLDESIQRVRWRDGWEKAVFMEPGKVYKVDVGPLVTSNAFLPGHRIRVEVSSSNFPRFERNLNTGGNNYDEKDPIVAHNRIQHGANYPSQIVLPILRRKVSSR